MPDDGLHGVDAGWRAWQHSSVATGTKPATGQPPSQQQPPPVPGLTLTCMRGCTDTTRSGWYRSKASLMRWPTNAAVAVAVGTWTTRGWVREKAALLRQPGRGRQGRQGMESGSVGGEKKEACTRAVTS